MFISHDADSAIVSKRKLCWSDWMRLPLTDHPLGDGTILSLKVDALSSRTIFRFYFPLALSWVFMGLDGPISVAVMSGLPDAKVNTAAFLILLSISIWIESPVIDLLSTSTTLAVNKGAVGTINRFTLWLIALVTVAHALATLTPLYWVIANTLLNVEPAVAAAVRPGLVILLPWSGLIGWRRSRQGMLIRNGRTRIIGIGTLLRVTVLLIVDIVLSRLHSLPGLSVAAFGLISSVLAEMLFIHVVSLPVVRQIPPDENVADLGMGRLAKFHAPLAATTMVKLVTIPIVAAGIARLADSTRSLAAYEVAWTILFLFRAIAFCLPEVVIALYKDAESRVTLRRFCLGVGAASSAVLGLLCLSRMDIKIFVDILGTRPDIAESAHWIFLACAPLPLLDASMSFVLGILTAHHLTMARMLAVFFSSVALIAAVVAGVAFHWTAPVMVGTCMGVAMVAELIVLCAAWIRVRGTLHPLSSLVA